LPARQVLADQEALVELVRLGCLAAQELLVVRDLTAPRATLGQLVQLV